MTNYVSRPEKVAAFQWFPEIGHPKVSMDNHLIKEHTCEKCGLKYASHGSIEVVGVFLIICPSNWVTTGNEQDFKVYTNEDFERIFLEST